VIVEIKRPALTLAKAEIDQAELYLRIIGKHQGSGRRRPRIYLVGREISFEARELADLRGYPELLTYSDIVSNCRRRYEEYLRIVESDA
jgi:hypothetical protein